MGSAQRARRGRGLFFTGAWLELRTGVDWLAVRRGGAGRGHAPSRAQRPPRGSGRGTGTGPGPNREEPGQMEEPGASRGGFLGVAPPPPWERPPAPLPGGGPDLEYVDLDEFLREHGLPPPSPPPPPAAPRSPQPERAPGKWGGQWGLGGAEAAGGGPGGPGGGPGGPGGPGGGAGAGGGPLDPRRLRFSQEELRPQPMARKARKVHVPDEQKDEKYWSRRSRNNAAAKRSRDARRLKENQISVRAAFLERENAALRLEVAAARRELQRFRAILQRYEAQHGQI
ncbi:D site-binding protein-like [Camarhynchus parvulus]|uniref:D site-binding protein-like n=1 Tax=Geospiza parvula TaxID=87175 RepID=UPI0012381B0E|nr:D site-binding protein-like [Camarhynchus parvulus]